MSDKKVVPFVIDLHHALRAGKHYDLRIQYPYRNQLCSFAIPKHRIPTVAGEKVLAIRTTDHSRVWLYFSGDIDDGYGKGKIEIIQKGYLEILSWSEKRIVFKVIKGNNPKLLDGYFLLFKFPIQKYANRDVTWNLMKIDESKLDKYIY